MSDQVNLGQRVAHSVDIVPFRGIEEFYDISGLLRDPKLFNDVLDAMAKEIRSFSPTLLTALDARGFLLAAPLALKLSLPLVMIRKRGKLPGEVLHTVYDKEYECGDILEIQVGALDPTDRVAVIDDILATGGSMRAAFKLIYDFGVKDVFGFCAIDIQLPGSSECLFSNNVNVTSLFSASQLKSSRR